MVELEFEAVAQEGEGVLLVQDRSGLFMYGATCCWDFREQRLVLDAICRFPCALQRMGICTFPRAFDGA